MSSLAKNHGLLAQNKVFLWLALATGLILLIPLIAMQLTSQVNWILADFVIIGALLFGAGSLFVLTARKLRKTSSRLVIGIIFLLITLYIWAELAVGIFTNLDN